ncbi:hypothetical protein L798_01281 [Zootermopsis nevadensis]|uniref:Uncharacterized protein n=1 Tax=Zootermopsis nevadensis TaxID=136037 RepID=A0A067QM00_ZOONE|nr:hypothetical protein L798_01281 [Zootermopsis nevadensis]
MCLPNINLQVGRILRQSMCTSRLSRNEAAQYGRQWSPSMGVVLCLNSQSPGSDGRPRLTLVLKKPPWWSAGRTCASGLSSPVNIGSWKVWIRFA